MPKSESRQFAYCDWVLHQRAKYMFLSIDGVACYYHIFYTWRGTGPLTLGRCPVVATHQNQLEPNLLLFCFARLKVSSSKTLTWKFKASEASLVTRKMDFFLKIVVTKRHSLLDLPSKGIRWRSSNLRKVNFFSGWHCTEVEYALTSLLSWVRFLAFPIFSWCFDLPIECSLEEKWTSEV